MYIKPEVMAYVVLKVLHCNQLGSCHLGLSLQHSCISAKMLSQHQLHSLVAAMVQLGIMTDPYQYSGCLKCKPN